MSSQIPPAPGNNKIKDPAGYGHLAGGYGYGYGYESYAEEGPHIQRNLRDYLAILLERKWYIILTFILVVTAATIYTFNATKIYTSTASMEARRQSGSGSSNREEINTQLGILESVSIIQQVSERLKGSDLQRFMAPYESALSPASILGRNREVTPRRSSYLINVSYSHPDPEVAARIANMFVDEYINYNISQQIAFNLKDNQRLEQQAARQLEKVQEIQRMMIALQEQAGTTSINQATNAEQATLQRMQATFTEQRTLLRDLETRWEQIQTAQKEGKPLVDLTFMNQLPLVHEQQSRISQLQVEQSALSQRYGPRHPVMQQLSEQIRSTQRELGLSLDSAVEKIRNEMGRTQRNLHELRAEIAEQEKLVMNIGRLAIEYANKQDELGVQRNLYAQIVGSMRVNILSAGQESPGARPLDAAVAPSSPSSPRVVLNIAAGILGGLLAGVALACLIAFLDDRVKSVFDVEKMIGFSLLGVVPRIKSSHIQEKAQAVFNNSHQLTTEAFRTVYSSLKIAPDSNAKTVLVTSTIPGEGKSFVASNLALTLAHNGYKTLLIDCDLRMPSVAKSLNQSNNVGLLSMMRGETTLEQSIIREAFPHLDIMTSGGQTRNPLRSLSHERFLDALSRLKEQYDKIVIDTPPIAAVSDALNLIHHVDGVIYTIKFNLAKKKTIKSCVKRMVRANANVYGAILNDVPSHGAGYYLYSDYYGSPAFAKYYNAGSDVADEKPIR